MHDEAAFGPLEAAKAIRDAQSLHLALRRRTSGVMWMLWGLIAPAILMTFGFAYSQQQGLAHMLRIWWVPLLWMPWAVLGILLTAMLWRSARLALPSATDRPRREVAWHVAIFVLIVVGGIWATVLLHAPIQPPAAAVGGLGVVSMVFGSTGILAVDAAERKVRFVTGALLLTAAVALSFLVTSMTILFVLAAVLVAAAFYGSGLWLVVRG